MKPGRSGAARTCSCGATACCSCSRQCCSFSWGLEAGSTPTGRAPRCNRSTPSKPHARPLHSRLGVRVCHSGALYDHQATAGLQSNNGWEQAPLLEHDAPVCLQAQQTMPHQLWLPCSLKAAVCDGDRGWSDDSWQLHVWMHHEQTCQSVV